MYPPSSNYIYIYIYQLCVDTGPSLEDPTGDTDDRNTWRESEREWERESVKYILSAWIVDEEYEKNYCDEKKNINQN